MQIKIFRWVARVLLVAAILFMMMFSLDVFETEGTVKEKAIGLFMHNIPAFMLIAVLIIAWKRELAGGILLIALTFGMMFYFRSFTSNPGSLIILLPFLIAGILFILCHVFSFRKQQNSRII
jgi:hypothetical protein